MPETYVGKTMFLITATAISAFCGVVAFWASRADAIQGEQGRAITELKTNDAGFTATLAAMNKTDELLRVEIANLHQSNQKLMDAIVNLEKPKTR